METTDPEKKQFSLRPSTDVHERLRQAAAWQGVRLRGSGTEPLSQAAREKTAGQRRFAHLCPGRAGGGKAELRFRFLYAGCRSAGLGASLCRASEVASGQDALRVACPSCGFEEGAGEGTWSGVARRGGGKGEGLPRAVTESTVQRPHHVERFFVGQNPVAHLVHDVGEADAVLGISEGMAAAGTWMAERVQ